MTAAGQSLSTPRFPSLSAVRPRGLRVVGTVASLAAALALALWAPIPALPDTGRAAVLSQVEQRLPGWEVERLRESWEGAYTVVTACAGHEIGFQFVPGHGLPAGSAWLQPDDPYSMRRLFRVSDHWRYLIWYERPEELASLSCADELARFGPSRD